MRAGRLGEILNENDNILVCCKPSTSQSGYMTEWNVNDFIHRFPDVEVLKVEAYKKKLLLYIYEYTAKAIYEKRYEEAVRYSNEFELHAFNSDLEYISRCIER